MESLHSDRTNDDFRTCYERLTPKTSTIVWVLASCAVSSGECFAGGLCVSSASCLTARAECLTGELSSGSGVKPRASFNTQGNCSESNYTARAYEKCKGVRLPSGALVFHRNCRPVQGGAGCVPSRVFKFRPRELGWRAWTQQTGKALDRLGRSDLAQKLVSCGSWAGVTDCPKCSPGEVVRVAVRCYCDVRICPWCARHSAKKRAKQTRSAMSVVPGLVEKEAGKVTARLQKDLASAEHRVDVWLRRMQASQDDVEHPARWIKAAVFLNRAAREVADIKFWIRKIDHRREWRWRFVTLTHWYDPSSEKEWTVDSIRTRIGELFLQWKALWDRIRQGGLAAASVRIEISELGNLHLHALYYGPWVSKRHDDDKTAWADHVQSLEVPHAGRSHVEVTKNGKLEDRSGNGAAIEASKYFAKSPTVARPGWLSGEKRLVMAPGVAALFCVATEGVQLARHFGFFRDALASIREDEPIATEHDHTLCPRCGASLGAVLTWPRERTDAVARKCRDIWKNVVVVIRG